MRPSRFTEEQTIGMLKQPCWTRTFRERRAGSVGSHRRARDQKHVGSFDVQRRK